MDNLGRTVAVPLQEQRSAGEHHLDIQTEGFASGVYAVQMRVGTVVLTRLLVVQK